MKKASRGAFPGHWAGGIRRVIGIASLVGLCLPGTAGARVAPTPKDGARDNAQIEIARVSARVGGGVGVEALNLEDGQVLTFNEKVLFPMASTFKVAVAGAVLNQVDHGELSLDQLVPVDPQLVLDSEGIAEIFPAPGLSVSVGNLLDAMLVRSDNSAANVLTKLAGGPAAITKWVRSVGVSEIRVDGDTIDIAKRFFAIEVPSGVPFNAVARQSAVKDPATLAALNLPNPKFDEDPRDTATPEGMVSLLSRIATGKALSAQSTALLLNIMSRCVTGDKRLRALLPSDTAVSEKTGTLGGSINDVGIITLPGNRGRVAVAVFIKMSGSAEREATIAQIGRIIYDYMLFRSENIGPNKGAGIK